MTSLFDVGKSAIQAYRQSLSVTGQNIANINTDGYALENLPRDNNDAINVDDELELTHSQCSSSSQKSEYF